TRANCARTRLRWTWTRLVPKLVRVVAIGLLALGLWQGVPRRYRALTKIEATHELSKEILAKITDMQAAQAAQPPSPEDKARASERIAEAVTDLAKSTDERSKRAFAALKKGDTRAAEDLFNAILEEKAREGQAANREAASVARNIAAFSRLTNVAKAADLYARAAELDPDNFENWIDLGDMSIEAGRLEQASAAFARAFAIADRLAKAEPGNSEWQRDLLISHEKIGDVQIAQGNLSGALASHQASLDIAARLAKADPSNAGWQRDLSVSHERIGNLQGMQGNLMGRW
ncbi:MAG: tetratricopeptide repeat protein, partial [Phyllobacterium sp.]|uniref:tetratricopeptide repeat protein n=1 Tax=Phyllobacterium sp. TaxID=1871046 RepID=UPI0030F2461F